MARYIDADDTLDTMLDVMVGTGYQSRAMDVIRNAPTADVEEVKYSQWHMFGYDEAICLNCGYSRRTPFESTNEAKAKWETLPKRCENCGAKMDGGKE